MVLLLLAGGIAAFFFVVFALDWRRTAKELGRRSTELYQLERKSEEFQKRKISEEVELAKKQEAFERLMRQNRIALEKLAEQKALGFPYLADAWADYLLSQDRTRERHLRTKSHPAHKAADQVRELATERRAYAKSAKVFEYKIKLYETLFPWLKDYTEEGIEDSLLRVGTEDVENQEDPASRWISPGEWEKLSVSQRNQIALDRYCSRQKTPWEIGRDYERFIGFRFEEAGCHVHYMGAIEGFDDLGRDLVVKEGKTTKIVQCKYWAERKQIHEKHIFQLFGTSVEYALRQKFGEKYERVDLFDKERILEGIEPVLYTSTTLSDRAKAFASALGVTVCEGLRIERYPIIKCNISRDGKNKIYHLPFDQQYDKVVITKNAGEAYASTVAEAEQLGFRRAYRWIAKA